MTNVLSGAVSLMSCIAALHAQLVTAGSPGLVCLPRVQRHIARLSTMSSRACAATLETATKQNVGAAASKSQTHVGLNSGHHMPLLGWGTSQATGDDCIKATKAAIETGFRVIIPGPGVIVLECNNLQEAKHDSCISTGAATQQQPH